MSAQKKPTWLLFILFYFLGNALFAQVHFKLQLMDEEFTYGVFAKVVGANPPEGTVTGSGQATIVMPLDAEWDNLISVNGLWEVNPEVISPDVSPNKKYISFGLIQAEPIYPIPLHLGEILLFKFNLNTCPSENIYLIDCGTPNQSDPYCPVYNTSDWNSGNDLSVIVFSNGIGYYGFHDNYALNASDCFDNDGDGFMNALEDTNGNGVYDEMDVSDLNNINSYPLQDGIQAKLQLIEANKWGVFAKPFGINPSNQTITGSARLAIVTSSNYNLSNLQSVNGSWQNNATVSELEINPGVSYYSFGLIEAEPNFPIPLNLEEETLLFTVEGEGDCPDFMQIIDCESDPYCIPLSADGFYTGNDFSVIDFGGSIQYYAYTGNYGLHAWDCHDSDGDGLPNAAEDTNGNGIFDEGDISDINDPASFPANGDINLKIQLLADGETWGVYAKTVGIDAPDFAPMVNSTITIVSENNFSPTDLISHSGGWETYDEINGPSENPENNYIVYFMNELEDFYMHANQDVLLFTFTANSCPEYLYIFDCVSENADSPFCSADNSLGFSINTSFTKMLPNDLGWPSFFKYAGNYNPYSWDCHDNDGDGFLNAHEDTNGNGIFDLFTDASDLNNPNVINPEKEKKEEVPDHDTSLGLIENNQNYFSTNSFQKKSTLNLFPNPASDLILIQLNSELIPTPSTLLIFNAQGQLIKTKNISKNTSLQLNISDLPTGLYFITLQKGKNISAREKFVKN